MLRKKTFFDTEFCLDQENFLLIRHRQTFQETFSACIHFCCYLLREILYIFLYLDFPPYNQQSSPAKCSRDKPTRAQKTFLQQNFRQQSKNKGGVVSTVFRGWMQCIIITKPDNRKISTRCGLLLQQNFKYLPWRYTVGQQLGSYTLKTFYLYLIWNNI